MPSTVPELLTPEEEVGEQIGPLLTPEEVGKKLVRHPKTVLNLFNRGELPGIKLGSRTVRFDPRDVEAYIDAHRTPVASVGGVVG
jgi:excisionase family DNA binding protein